MNIEINNGNFRMAVTPSKFEVGVIADFPLSEKEIENAKGDTCWWVILQHLLLAGF